VYSKKVFPRSYHSHTDFHNMFLKAENKSKRAEDEYRGLVDKYETARGEFESKMTESAKVDRFLSLKLRIEWYCVPIVYYNNCSFKQNKPFNQIFVSQVFVIPYLSFSTALTDWL